MKGFAQTSKGLESTAASEINELIKAQCKTQDSCVVFDFENYEDLCLLCYKAQSIDRILLLFGSFGFNNFFDEFEKLLDLKNFESWLKRGKKVKVECKREGTHDFKSVDVEEEISKYLKKKLKIEPNYKDYDFILSFYINKDKCYYGLDFAGFELNKRGYKIFIHSGSSRGTIAYALLRESGYKKNEVLLDPFSRDGVLAIETAMYASNFPVNYFKKDRFAFLKLDLGFDYDKFFAKADKTIKKLKQKINCFDNMFKFVDYCRKNAKIAGVEKELNFSRTEIEWLDIKFKKSSIDRIVTIPPFPKESLQKVYNEVFYQAAYILKDKGTLSVLTQTPDFIKKHAQKHNFNIQREREVYSGEQKLFIIVFEKSTTE